MITNVAVENITHLFPPNFYGSGLQTELNWVLSPGSHRAAVKELARAKVSSEVLSPLPSAPNCWQNSAPCGYRT